MINILSIFIYSVDVQYILQEVIKCHLGTIKEYW
jgi:hypothetical protein